MLLDEGKKHKKHKKAISAQAQVGGKVNAGIMDAMCFGACGGMCEDVEDFASKQKYKIAQKPGPSEYAHVIKEGKNESDKKFPYKKYMLSLLNYMEDNGIKVKPFPKVVLNNDKQNGLFIKTGFYEPEKKSVTLFINDRNEKDIMRSFAHELIHHNQNLLGKNLSFSSLDNVKDNEELEKIEAEAYLKGNVIFRKWTEYAQGKKNLNESIETEIIKPEDVDLSSFNLKKNLNKTFWKDEHLDSRIRLKLLDIADDFIDTLKIEQSEVEDIIITGSLANYNWDKKYSDIDLHILVDFKDIDDDTDFVKDYFDSKKKEWNNTHGDIKIYGFPIEVYVQDVNEKHSSSGYYSLEKDKWIEEPDLDYLKSAKINKKVIKNKVSEYTDKIDKLGVLLKKCGNDEYKLKKIYTKATKLFEKIREERTHGFEQSDNELNNGNLIFKSLRRLNYIEKIIKIKTDAYNKLNSLV